jgi:hypothetical protein
MQNQARNEPKAARTASGTRTATAAVAPALRWWELWVGEAVALAWDGMRVGVEVVDGLLVVDLVCDDELDVVLEDMLEVVVEDVNDVDDIVELHDAVDEGVH